nr:hypothetical protein B0A51_06462 [Rachicladosporium sp. CCFEE 5018]
MSHVTSLTDLRALIAADTAASNAIQARIVQLEDPEPDKSTWPLLYQMLDVDPNTEDNYVSEACNLSLKRLARRNNPKFLPNDTEAPKRWAAVMKAYEILTDPERKRFYDMRNKTPTDLEGFGLTSLQIE